MLRTEESDSVGDQVMLEFPMLIVSIEFQCHSSHSLQCLSKLLCLPHIPSISELYPNNNRTNHISRVYSSCSSFPARSSFFHTSSLSQMTLSCSSRSFPSVSWPPDRPRSNCQYPTTPCYLCTAVDKDRLGSDDGYVVDGVDVD